MIKLFLNNRRTCSSSKRPDDVTIKYAIIFLFVFILIPNLNSQNYYVTSDANGSGNGSQVSPWTIYQAAANATAGDTILVQAGTYNLNTISFSNSGTASNPIVFRGVRVDQYEKTADGISNTLFASTQGSSAMVSVGGAYITFENMIMRQNYDKEVLMIGGDHFTMDSVITQYPSGSGGSNHTIRTTADYTTVRYCYFWQGPKTIFWVQPSYPNTCDNFLMEYTTITDFDNHYAIQLMPTTQTTPVPKVTNTIIRNCIFLDGGYESPLYVRNVTDCKIYNNLFINSTGRYADLQLFITDGIVQEPGYDTRSIFANNTSYSPMTGAETSTKYPGSVLFFGDSNQNGWTIKNNVGYYMAGTNLYRYICNTSTTAGQDFDIDYNMIYVASSTASSLTSPWNAIGSCSSSSYSWASWKSTFGFDTHSIIDIAPDFVSRTADPNTWDFHLQTNRTGVDLSSWGITTDYLGNQRDPNNPTIGAFEFSTGGVDITPPRVTTALFINATTLRVTFSETIALPGAENPSNYTINNGISVNSVSYSGNQATLTTSAHTNGNYTITVNNVTDIAGNIIDPNNNTAQYNLQLDVTPPELVSASIIDSVTLRLIFSEVIDPTTGQNTNNYTISNGISILGVNLSGSQVTLSTSIHTTGNYTITVNNVTDIAGNLISPQNNTLDYEFQSGSGDNSILLPVSSVEASVVPEPTHYPEKTIDGMGYYQGDPDSRWAGDTMPEWLVYDLGDVQIINQTRLSFYNWNVGRIYNYTVQVSTDNVNWSEVRTNVQSSLEEWSIEDLGSIEARYIKIIFVANNQNAWAGLWESEFWGHILNPTSIEDEKTTPTSFVMDQNYPNPFNPTTMIRVSLPKSSHIKLTVYNILGEYITELANGQYDSGVYEFNFNASGLSSGLYIYRIESSDFVETKKMMVMK